MLQIKFKMYENFFIFVNFFQIFQILLVIFSLFCFFLDYFSITFPVGPFYLFVNENRKIYQILTEELKIQQNKYLCRLSEYFLTYTEFYPDSYFLLKNGNLTITEPLSHLNPYRCSFISLEGKI